MFEKTDRTIVLNRIFEHLCGVADWICSPARCAQSYWKAEALIEELEVCDCGQIGGYDPDNINERITLYPLYDRFLTLLRKNNDEKNIKKNGPWENVKQLTNFFDRLYWLADESSNNRAHALRQQKEYRQSQIKRSKNYNGIHRRNSCPEKH